MASSAAASAAAGGVMAVPMTLGFNGAASPPALCATGPFAIACAPGRASAALTMRVSDSAVLRATMFVVSLVGDRLRTKHQARGPPVRAPRGTLVSAAHPGA